VIHGAGNVGPGSDTAVNQTDQAACDQHFMPKVKGLLVLEELLRGRKLDFCLLLSSLSSVLGGLGFVAYSAANNFMDAFAGQQNQAKSHPWISVNWDGWQFTEGGPDLIRPEEGMAVFERVLKSGKTQVVASVTDLQARIDQWINLKSISTTAKIKAESQPATHARPNLGSLYASPNTEVEAAIAEIWQEMLGVAPIGIHDNFFELGGHSLLAIQIVSRIRNTFQIELPVQQLFETPTVTQLAESIEKERGVFAPDDDGLADILSMVEDISEEEVRRLLAGSSS
jgi:acyl carrier protein